MADGEGLRLFEFIKRRRAAYKMARDAQFAIEQPATQNMLIDLAEFCRASETCVVTDEQGKVDETKTFIMEGRREVWLRIQNHLNLTTKQLYRLSTGEQFQIGEENDE